ncbi:MAG: hypothetical protein HY303_03980 [Candidatus Wallbacteria bacterium]|nr:hypothetical protein [Candidatus Wallbacteria bacterium]
MKEIKEKSVWVGALVGTVMFLAAGLVPALLYGGYLGVLIGSTLIGGPVEAGGVGGYLVLVGMAVGTVSVWFLFIVAGSAVGAMSSWTYAKLHKSDEAE